MVKLMIEKISELFNAISKVSLDYYAILISTLSLFASFYNILSPKITKIKVGIECICTEHVKTGEGYIESNCATSYYITIRNFSQKTKYIQQIYMKYKYSQKGRAKGKFLITDELLVIKPQEKIRTQVKICDNIFLKGQDNSTRVYAIAVDTLDHEWTSSDFVTVGMLRKTLICT